MNAATRTARAITAALRYGFAITVHGRPMIEVKVDGAVHAAMKRRGLIAKVRDEDFREYVVLTPAGELARRPRHCHRPLTRPGSGPS